jgi:periplasmic protein CpxP/Spy
MRRTGIISVLAGLLLSAAGAAAQSPDTGPARSATGAPQTPLRQQLERRIRRRFAQVVQTRLGLTDAQMAQLRATNAKFGAQRRPLAARERSIRQALRGEMRPGVAADQDRVSSLTDSLFQIQRERLDLAQAEQKELSGYLSPVQRVQYYALQEALRRRLEQLQQAAAEHPLLFNGVGPQNAAPAAAAAAESVDAF